MLVMRPAISAPSMNQVALLRQTPSVRVSELDTDKRPRQPLFLENRETALPDEERFLLADRQAALASYGVARASVSCPTMMCPFSSLNKALRLDPEGPDAESSSGLHQAGPDVKAVLRGDVDLVAQLADKADAEDHGWNGGHEPLPNADVGERLGREVDLGQRAEKLTAARTRRGSSRPAACWS